MLALVALSVFGPAIASASGIARLQVMFDRGAKLGGSTAIHTRLSVDVEKQPSPVAEMQMYYPASLGVITSGLGQATCRRPAADFVHVLIELDPWSGLAGCPPDSVLGEGTVLARVLLSNGVASTEHAGITMLSGPISGRNIGLVVFITGYYPFGGKFVYGGELTPARAPFGGALDVHVPQIPGFAETATVALQTMRMDLGSSRLVYYERRGGTMLPYHPDGIALPKRCPKAGFPFLVILTFGDRSRARSAVDVRCPKR
ncbi:MAG: hypothetical protein ACTHOE_08715 [Conexibacter sp.]